MPRSGEHLTACILHGRCPQCCQGPNTVCAPYADANSPRATSAMRLQPPTASWLIANRIRARRRRAAPRKPSSMQRPQRDRQMGTHDAGALEEGRPPETHGSCAPALRRAGFRHRTWRRFVPFKHPNCSVLEAVGGVCSRWRLVVLDYGLRRILGGGRWCMRRDVPC